MKFLVSLILNILLAYTAFLYSAIVPWYGFAFGALLVGLIVPQQAWTSWLSGFLGLLICWALIARHLDKLNEGILSSKMAAVLPLSGSPVYLILATALVGGLVGGFAALSGAFLRFK